MIALLSLIMPLPQDSLEILDGASHLPEVPTVNKMLRDLLG